MRVSDNDARDFATILIKNIKEEFSIKYLSKNLVDTIELVELEDRIQVIIPAEVYDVYKYVKDGIVLHNRGTKSYASALDTEGGTFVLNGKKITTDNHIGYVNEVIEKSLNEWIAMKRKYEFVSKTEL